MILYIIFKNLPQQRNPGRLSFLRFVRNYFFFKNFFKKKKIDIFIHTSLPLIRNPRGKTITNIFDIRYMKKDYENSFCKRLIYKIIVKYCLHYSNYIITISNFIKNEIINTFNVSKSKLKVIYCSINLQKKSKKISNNNFILSVGHFEKRKNYFNLVRSFYHLRKKFNYLGKLVIISNNFTSNNLVIDFIKKKKLENFVIIKKQTTNDQLKKYYANADLFVFPSTYEGFGLPILEALVQNCKVLTSNIKVFREILGPSYIYFNPFSFQDMSKKMYLCISKRNKFNNINNRKIFKKFSSKKIASEYLNFLNRI